MEPNSSWDFCRTELKKSKNTHNTELSGFYRLANMNFVCVCKSCFFVFHWAAEKLKKCLNVKCMNIQIRHQRRHHHHHRHHIHRCFTGMSAKCRCLNQSSISSLQWGKNEHKVSVCISTPSSFPLCVCVCGNELFCVVRFSHEKGEFLSHIFGYCWHYETNKICLWKSPFDMENEQQQQQQKQGIIVLISKSKGFHDYIDL